MDWFKMHPRELRAHEFIGSNPVERATWLSVLCHCVEQENGGRLIGAKHWKDRQWQQTCGVMLKEVLKASKLLAWDGDDLVIWNYPVDSELEVSSKRETGRAGAEKRWGKPKVKPEEPNGVTNGDAIGNANAEKSREEKSRTPLPPKGEEAVFPEELKGLEFVEAWKRWEKHRREIKKPLKGEMTEAQLKKLATYGAARAIQIIDYTIEKGWQGLADEEKVPAFQSPAIGNTSNRWLQTANEIVFQLSERPWCDETIAELKALKPVIDEHSPMARKWLKEKLTPEQQRKLAEAWRE